MNLSFGFQNLFCLQVVSFVAILFCYFVYSMPAVCDAVVECKLLDVSLHTDASTQTVLHEQGKVTVDISCQTCDSLVPVAVSSGTDLEGTYDRHMLLCQYLFLQSTYYGRSSTILCES